MNRELDQKMINNLINLFNYMMYKYCPDQVGLSELQPGNDPDYCANVGCEGCWIHVIDNLK